MDKEKEKDSTITNQIIEWTLTESPHKNLYNNTNSLNNSINNSINIKERDKDKDKDKILNNTSSANKNKSKLIINNVIYHLPIIYLLSK